MEALDNTQGYESSLESTPKRKKSALDVLLGPKEASTVPSTISELDQYFSENPALCNESPLLWWKAKVSATQNLLK